MALVTDCTGPGSVSVSKDSLSYGYSSGSRGMLPQDGCEVNTHQGLDCRKGFFAFPQSLCENEIGSQFSHSRTVQSQIRLVV